MGIGVSGGTSALPANQSRSQLTRQVVSYLMGGDDPDLLGYAHTELNLAVDKLNTWNWNRLNANQSITMVLSDVDYTLAADVKTPIAVERLDSDSKPVGRLGFKQLQALFRDHTWRREAGHPTFYSIDENSRLLLLDRPPSQSFINQYPTLKFWYHRRLPYLLNGSETHDSPPEFRSFMVWQARSSLAATMGDIRKEGIAARKALDMWNQLRNDDADTATDFGGYRC